jgi:hypothetical protein
VNRERAIELLLNLLTSPVAYVSPPDVKRAKRLLRQLGHHDVDGVDDEDDDD